MSARLMRNILAGACCAVLAGAGTATADPVAPGGPSIPGLGEGSVSSVPVASGPEFGSHAAAADYAEAHPGSAPRGVNDDGCVPSEDRPYPVVLAHGTDSDSFTDYAAIGPMLADEGWCVFALDYGLAEGAESYGTGDIRVSAAQFGTFVDDVLERTGAPRVDVVGYSQGATVTRYWINALGGANKVDRWVGIASPSYGGTFYGIGAAAATLPGAVDFVENEFSVALVQQLEGSDLLAEVNLPSDTVPGVRYTTIGSDVDEVIQPAGNVALHGPGAVNYVIQELCPDNLTGHFNMVYDPFTLRLVLHALDPETYDVGACTTVELGAGIPEMILQSNS